MEDSLGLYYLPQPSIPAVRIYVRRNEEGSIEFRMWDADHPEVWEKHQWLTSDIIALAAQMFKSEHDNGASPESNYDLRVAEALLEEQEQAEAKAKAKAEAKARRQKQGRK
ncbi:MAG: hypothetical protein Q3990_07215 [Desulfovibrionaceae bacterium]|nr:hypothetical protein [Desulfovibrionaceae bacterium]